VPALIISNLIIKAKIEWRYQARGIQAHAVKRDIISLAGTATAKFISPVYI
jgi:hypothetical protein